MHFFFLKLASLDLSIFSEAGSSDGVQGGVMHRICVRSRARRCGAISKRNDKLIYSFVPCRCDLDKVLRFHYSKMCGLLL